MFWQSSHPSSQLLSLYKKNTILVQLKPLSARVTN
jgi:hypothetical protein